MLKRIRNSFCVLCAALIMAVGVAGCTLFENDDKYEYGLIVAKVGDIEITKKRLMDGFNSFGYQYVSDQGNTLQEGYDKTLNQLIDYEISARLSINMYGPLTERERDAARKTSYDNFKRSYDALEKETREKKGISEKENPTPPEEEETPAGVKYNTYVPKVSRENGYVMNIDSFKITPEPEYVFKNHTEFLDSIRAPRGPSAIDQTIAQETINRIMRNLESGENGIGQYYNEEKMRFEFRTVKYDTDAEREATLYRELERMQHEEEKAILVRRLQDMFQWGLGNVDRTQDAWRDRTIERTTVRGGALVTDLTEISFYEYLKDLQRNNFSEFKAELNGYTNTYVDNLVSQAREDFLNKVTNARYRYDEGFDDKDGYYAKILDGFSSLYFIPADIAKQFFNVSHILLQYNDDEKAELEAINARFAKDQNEENKERDLAILRGKMKIDQINVNGDKTGNTFGVDEVLNYVKSYVDPFSQEKPIEAKTRDFRDMIYMFNADPGMQNPEYEYVIGRDTRKDRGVNSTETENMSRMVKEFTEASRVLFNYNDGTNLGGFMRAKDYVDTFKVDRSIFKNNEYDNNANISTLGTMSGLVWTDYGAHIIMYTRDIKDYIFTNTAEFIRDGLDKYLFATLTSYGEKTFFDMSVDSAISSDYTGHEERLVNDWKTNKETVYFKSRYKNLTKQK